MTRLKEILGSGGLFLVLYVTPAVATYVVDLTLAGGALRANMTVTDPSDVVMPTIFGFSRFTVVGICYAVMLVACLMRGVAIRRRWLVSIPLLGAFFDLVVAFLPLIPTLFHVAALVASVKSSTE